jgi:hypothetical protein
MVTGGGEPGPRNDAEGGGMDSSLRSSLFSPAAAHGLVLAHRPPGASPVECVVSDHVWADVVVLLRWATAVPRDDDDRPGAAWRLAARCAALLRALPGLCEELGERWSPVVADVPDLPGADRLRLVADRLGRLLAARERVSLTVLGSEVDALGAAAVAALAERTDWAAPPL